LLVVQWVGMLYPHAGNTKPSSPLSIPPPSLRIQHCSLEGGKAMCWPHTRGHRGHSTRPSLPLTTQPASSRSLHCSRMRPRWSFHIRAHRDCNTKPFWLGTSLLASWRGLHCSQMEPW